MRKYTVFEEEKEEVIEKCSKVVTGYLMSAEPKTHCMKGKPCQTEGARRHALHQLSRLLACGHW